MSRTARPRPHVAAFAALVASCVVLVACAWRPRAAGDPRVRSRADGANATVVEVVDGDTIRVTLLAPGRPSEVVRLIGVDTPETRDPRRPVQCFGTEAAAYTARLLPPSTRVRLVRDAEARDRYGRLLAYVHRARDGLVVNVALAAGGFARPLTIAPNVALTAEILAAADAARRAGHGLWARCAHGGRDPPKSA